MADTYQIQLDRLKAHGLIVSDTEEGLALHALQHHSHDRILDYRAPFADERSGSA